jgi:hypothetical protein
MPQFVRYRLPVQKTLDAMKRLRRSSRILSLLKRSISQLPQGTDKREAAREIAGLEAMMRTASIKIAQRQQAARSAKVNR